MNRRFCPRCKSFKDADRFKLRADGVGRSRVCTRCNEARRHMAKARPSTTLRGAPLEKNAAFPGVDIDRVHYVRGALRKPCLKE